MFSNLPTLPALPEKLTNFFQTAKLITLAIIRDFIQGKLPLRATSLVYTTILSFVPLLALSFSVLKSFGAHNQLAPFLEGLLAPLGDKGLDVAANVLLFVDNIKVGVLGALGLGFLLFTVVSLVQKIESAYNSVWQVEKPRPHVQRFTGYLSVITVGPIVLFSLVGLKAKFTTNPLVAETLGLAVNTTSIMPIIIDAVSVVAMPIILFTFMNKAIPNTKVNWVPAILSGIATAYMWKGVASGFGNFMSNSANYDAIYSSFAIILMVFIWLYLNWLVILIGSSLCFYIQNPEQAKLALNKANISCQNKIYNALLLLKNVSERFDKGEKPLTLSSASKLFGSDVAARNVIHNLEEAEIVSYIEGGTEEIALLKSVDKVTLFDIMNSLSGHVATVKGRKKDKSLATFMTSLEDSWRQTTLKEIFDKK